ncbi:MAG: hypothetical protein ABIO59_04620 [Luteimonas sp.]
MDVRNATQQPARQPPVNGQLQNQFFHGVALGRDRDDKFRLRDEQQREAIARDRQLRLSEQQQQRLIAQQREQAMAYQRYLDQRQQMAEQRAQQLQQQNRMAQYQYQQRYYERLREQREQLASQQYDYGNDPYFYTPDSYRYSYGGNQYRTNQYGADMLRQAANVGYDEGIHAAQADRQDGAPPDYRDSFAYQDANYGYNGYYVSQRDYNYYFRKGFRRGYSDGYDQNYRYGRYDQNNGSASLLQTVLSLILNLQPLG